MEVWYFDRYRIRGVRTRDLGSTVWCVRAARSRLNVEGLMLAINDPDVSRALVLFLCCVDWGGKRRPRREKRKLIRRE